MVVTQPSAMNRRHGPQHSVTEYFQGTKRFYDKTEQMTVVKIYSGDYYVTQRANEMLATILGSCVSACIRDPHAGVGGMNHFLLPGDEQAPTQLSASARYGVFAMESLINGILKAGGHKDRLEIKVFGGGNVIGNSSRIGSKNAQFIRNFLRAEGYRIASEDLEGDLPRRVHYYPTTGKVMLRTLRRRDDLAVVAEEKRYTHQIQAAPIEGEIELF